MLKLISAIRKEFLILIRDVPGLLILFIMPVLLIMVVVVAQQNALRSSRETRTEILFVDNSNSSVSKAIEQSLDSSGFYSLVRMDEGKSIDENIATQLIRESKFPLGVVIAANDTAIHILIDPALQDSYRNSLAGSVTYLIRSAQSRIAVAKILKTMYPGMEEVMSAMIAGALNDCTPVQEIYPSKNNPTIQPSLLQNSIPGFILFAMFFIVIPLSGSMISEKNEGSFYRLKTLPVPAATFLSSKVLLYTVVCLIQFLMMVLTGLWLLPSLFGFSSFQFGHHYFAIILTTIAAGLAAIGFGLIVGTWSTTHGQAALFGSVMVIILGIISGTFLPIHLFPEPVQAISRISPIRWGIDNYLDLFIRDGNLLDVLPNILLLLLFFIFALVVSINIFARRK